MGPNKYRTKRSPEYFKSMFFDLVVIGSTQDCKAYVGVSVNARGKESANGAGTDNEHVEGIANRRHTGTRFSVIRNYFYIERVSFKRT